MTEKKVYDIIIVGGGPAGLVAATYAVRSNMKTALLEKAVFGGQAASTSKEIENIPGFDKISGMEFAMQEHAKAEAHGLQTYYDEATEFKFGKDEHQVKLYGGETIYGKAVILSMGVEPRRMGLEDEIALTGRGISYCVECDGNFFKDKVVTICGGGNAAMDAVFYLSKLVKEINIINDTPDFLAMPLYVKRLQALVAEKKNINIFHQTVLTKLNRGANNKLASVVAKNTKTGKETLIETEGVFVNIGRYPSTDIIKGKINLNEAGYIITNDLMETNVMGVYAAGDVRANVLKQVAVACGEGSIAAVSASKYVRTKK